MNLSIVRLEEAANRGNWFVFRPSPKVTLPLATGADLKRFVMDPTAARMNLRPRCFLATLLCC